MKKQQQFLKNISYALDIIIILISYSFAKRIILNNSLQVFNYNFILLSIVLLVFNVIFFKNIH
jgi:hypothetical protein